MIVLDSITSLQIVLGGAADPAPVIHVTYWDYNVNNEPTLPATYRVAANGASDVTILAAPSTNPVRELLYASVYNLDNASITLTIKTDNGTTEFTVLTVTLLTLEMLFYEKGRGWYALTTAGAFKNAV